MDKEIESDSGESSVEDMDTEDGAMAMHIGSRQCKEVINAKR